MLYRVVASRVAPGRQVLVLVGQTPPEKLADRIEGAELVAGHLTWAAVAAFREPPDVLTVLRDPTEWVLSLYGFLRQHSTSGVFRPRTQMGADEAVARSLDDLLLDPTSALRSMIGPFQVGFLSGDTRVDMEGHFDPFQVAHPSGDAPVDVKRRFEMAVRNLEACAWVGTTETLDRDLQTLAFRFGWKPFGIPTRHMVTAGRLDASSLSAVARRALDGLVEADRALHARAGSLADTRHREMVDHLLETHALARVATT